ncbi:F0F1 ATP synthase subunit A [Nocardioides pocheonensis]|uniref:ATP synthase subunit a n=1 Tax=Nocardioides pocheonensis TaxID=661485 RepID=A0A3N0GS40_9ACTN|nr:F0F1 ATP synthase subunit A [Nocardioides pocheonensis]RNM15294.1 ATP synthase F0 subunit A [Nocardioides pocheonensis]
MTGFAPLEIHITPGEHPTREWFGMTVNIDTVISTVVAGAIVILLGLLVRRALTRSTEDHVPTKMQMIWEGVVKEVNTQVEDNLGKVHPYVAPLAISLFFFILIANWLELVPTELNQHAHLLPAPTADTNLTYAMAIFAVVSVWIYGIRKNGVGYFKHFVQPYPVLLPLNILEELVKPITLALRLFGNIFAGGIMLALIAAIPWWAGMPIANVLWKMFDMVIGGLQAFIFALLTVLYFAMASAGHDEHEDHEERVLNDPTDQEREAREAAPAEPQPAA